MTRRATTLFQVVALAILSSCGGGGGPTGGGIPNPQDGSGMVVRGTILDEQGREIFETIVRATAYLYDDGVCGTVPIADPFETTVNEEGGYSLLLAFDRDEFDGCFNLEIIPPADSGYLGDAQFFFDQEMNEFDSNEPIVALNLNFVLERG